MAQKIESNLAMVYHQQIRKFKKMFDKLTGSLKIIRLFFSVFTLLSEKDQAQLTVEIGCTLKKSRDMGFRETLLSSR